MALLIKINGETPIVGAKRIYRDALVTQGSLLLIDFSNRGTFSGDSPKTNDLFGDLAKETADKYGVVNKPFFIVHNSSYSLTSGKGLNLRTLGHTYNDGLPRAGVHFGDSILNRLKLITNNKILFIFWVRFDPDHTNNGGVAIQSSSSKGSAIRGVVGTSGTISMTIGGAASPSSNISSTVRQVAIVYNGEGQKLNNYNNLNQLADSTGNATGFGEPVTPLLIGDVLNDLTPGIDASIYRVLIEDLTSSGREAIDVINKDYNYCHGLGEFPETSKRPFIDMY